MINMPMNTHIVKLYDDESGEGLKKFWQLIVGYTKVEMHIKGGYIY